MTTATPQPKTGTKIDIHDIAHRLWETADELRANSHLKAAEYSIPVLGLIFLKFADSRFAQAEAELAGSSTGRRHIGKANYQARGVLYLPPQSRFANLLLLKESDNLGKAINDAMAAIEEENHSLMGRPPPDVTSRSPMTHWSVCCARSTPSWATSRATPSARSTSTSSGSSPSLKGRRAASTSRQRRSSD